MLLKHIAAVLVFSGPLFWFGLWLAVDPVGVAGLADLLARVLIRAVQKLSGSSAGQAVQSEESGIPRRHRRTLRLAGVVLVLVAVVI
jgi:hypothetical protein